MKPKQITRLRKAINNNANSVELNSIFEDIKKEDLLQDANAILKEQREQREVELDDPEDDLFNQGFFNKTKPDMTLDQAIERVAERLQFKVKK